MNIEDFKVLVVEKTKKFVEKNPSIKTTFRWDQDKYFKFRTEKACFRENTHYELRVIPASKEDQDAHFVMEYHFEKKDRVRDNFMRIIQEHFSDVSRYYFKKDAEHRIRLVNSLPDGENWYSMADDVDVVGNVDSALNDLALFVENDEEKLVEVIHQAEAMVVADEEKFKHLLEYFVAHLEYKQNNITDTNGYKTYIEPLKKNFVQTGKSGKDWGLTRQIECWNSYSNGRRVSISIDGRTGVRFAGKTSYLNWENTWFNVRARWNESNQRIIGFYLTNTPTPNPNQVGNDISLTDLGLYDGLPPNEMLKNFYKDFENMLNKAEDEMLERLNEEQRILLKKKNLILQGAPGTGKTFETASLALKMLNEDVDYSDRSAVMKQYKLREKEGRIAFVTFHQTMDYESFVEGLHAVSIKDDAGKAIGGVGYEPKAGIFKEICDRARTKDGDDIETCIDKYLASITGFDNKKLIPTSTGKSKIWVWRNSDDATTISVRSEVSKIEDESITPSPLNIQKVKDQATGNGRENNWTQYATAFINAVKAEYTVKAESEKLPYVLIIDEINRGNVSKIFGELITLLEPDKRQGEENEITAKLTYSGDSFTVPSNLYVIGTMNTTDRSVGAIDYAIRRRFAFKTLTSRRSVIEKYNKFESDAVKIKALELYDQVVSFLNEEGNTVDMEFDDLMVGHSYFLSSSLEDLYLKWDYEVLPLLNEFYKDGVINKNPANHEWKR